MAEISRERLREAVGNTRQRAQAARERAADTRQRAAEAKERAEETAVRARDTAVEVGERVERGVERVDRGIDRVDEGLDRVEERVERAQELSQRVEPVGQAVSVGAQRTAGIEPTQMAVEDPTAVGIQDFGGGQPFGGNPFGMGQAPPAEPVEPRRDERPPPREEAIVERQPADPFGLQMGVEPRGQPRERDPVQKIFGGGFL